MQSPFHRRRPTAGAPAGTGRTDDATMWRYLAYEWGGGATLLSLVVVVAGAPGGSAAGLLGISALAYVFVAVMLAGATRLPRALVQPTLLLGNLLISLVVYCSGHELTFFAMYYLWLNVYAFYFFGRRSGWMHMTIAMASYAVTLVVLSGTVPLTPWLMTVGTMVFVGSMVGALKARVDRLVADLADAARRDPLTGLLNRRGFDEALAGEFERARRNGLPLSLVIADIDHFKLVNDAAGHISGDLVLRRMGQLLDGDGRQIDSTARIGGEEFALLLPDTGARGAFALAERLRAQVRERFASDAQPITASFGIATFPEHVAGPGELVSAADNALYAAKRMGRDRSIVAGGQPPSAAPEPLGPPLARAERATAGR